MSNACSDDVRFDGQRVELLPARTVLSTFARAADGGKGGGATDPISSLLSQLAGLNKAVPGGDHGDVGTDGNGTRGV